MVLKAVLFDFNGVIINDERLHEQLIEQLLLEENVRPKPGDYKQFCLGRSDRACLTALLETQGRIVFGNYLSQLLQRKTEAYRQQLEKLPQLLIYPTLGDLIDKLRLAQFKMAIVSGALRSEIELVLDQAQLAQHFSVIVAGDDITTSKPEPDGYLLAIERLNQKFPELNLQPSDCLAIEDSLAGIEAAKRARIQVVGVAHTYPFHMLQRLCHWTIDNLKELEVDRVRRVFEGRSHEADREIFSRS